MFLYDAPLAILDGCWNHLAKGLGMHRLLRVSVAAFFSRKASGYVISGFSFLGIGAIETSHYYLFGSVCICIAAFWFVVWWLTDTRLKHNRHKKKASKDEIGRQRRVKLIGLVVALAIAAGVLVRGYRLWTDYVLDQLEGRLFPASDRMPPNNCGPISKDAVVVFEGGEIAHVVETFPHTILKVRGTDAISIDRSSDGTMNLFLDVRDADGKVIVSFNEKGFVINHNNYLRKERPDRSTLRVEDQNGEWVLEARYLNPHAFRVSGKLRYPDVNRQITIPFSRIHNVCIEKAGLDISVD